MTSLPRWVASAAWGAFVALGFLGCFYVAWASVAAPGAVSAVLGLLFAALLAWLARRVARARSSPESPAASSPRRALLPILALGVVVRAIWIAAFPPAQFSDAADYVRLAEGIAETGEYAEPATPARPKLRAFRPPGYPAFLAAFLKLFGNAPWIPAVTNLLAFVGATILLYELGAAFSGPRGGGFAALLLAIWPAHVMLTGLAHTETVSLFLYLLFYAAWLRVLGGGGRWTAVLGLAGALTAFVRPSLLPLPFLLLAVAILLRPFRARHVAHAVAASLVMAALIAPWTLRNHRLLGGFAAISTNGGDVFYRANNPMATGSYVPRGEVDLWRLAHDELGWNRVGFEKGKAWIRENPGAFLRLAVKKQAIMLGEDGFGPYYGLARGLGVGGVPYEIALAVCNLWWAGFWSLVVLGAVRARDSFCRTPAGVAAILMVFALVAVHSVFESQPRHHVPVFGHLALLAAFLRHPPREQRSGIATGV